MLLHNNKTIGQTVVLLPSEEEHAMLYADDSERLSLVSSGATGNLTARGLSQQELIERSWERCSTAGLSPSDQPDLDYVSQTELRQERGRLELIRRIARAELDLLYGQIAGTRFAVALANENGLIMDARADEDFKRVARERNIRLGSLWRESLQGTNALGTCALVQHPVLVHASEHYLDRYKTLTCASAPIFDPAGRIIAILDASSDSCPRPPHTLALVNFSAKTIEMGYFRDHYQDQLILSFHSRREYRYTVSAGLIALDTSGQLLATNRQALFILDGMQLSKGNHFNDIFTTPFGTVIDRVLTDGEVIVADHVGSHYFLTIENTNRLQTTHTLQPQPGDGPSPTLHEGTADVHAAARSVDATAQVPCHGARFVANDPHLIERLKYLTNAVKRSLPILITGETGTGKEVFAKYIHQTSGRTGDFVPVNCGAIPENLVEAELFGYVDGAYTGSRKGGADGLFHQAHGGTIFLDELSELPLATQVKLLRVLDNRRYRPVGGTQDIKVDIQVVAATNANLQQAVQTGAFRSDLFYRLSTISIQLPNIRERSDFEDLAKHILAKVDPAVKLTRCGLDELLQYDWPGNIRELRNFLTRMVVLNEGEKITRKEVQATFEMADLIGIAEPSHQLPAAPESSPFPERPTAPTSSGEGQTTRLARQRLLAERIQQACDQHLYNVSKVAREVGVSRSTVYKYLKETR